MAQVQYKYNLNHRFSLLPRSITLEQLIAHLEKCGISERTFYRDRSMVAGEISDMTVERLMKYAQVFNCQLQELINYKVKAQPIEKFSDRVKSPLA